MLRRTSVLNPATFIVRLFRHVPRSLLWFAAVAAVIPLLGSTVEIGAASPPFKYVVRRFGFLPVESPLGRLPVEPSLAVRDAKATGSNAYGMNNHGDVVGICGYEAICDDPDSAYYGNTISWLYAFHYTRDGQLLNLSKLWDSWGLQNLQDNLNMGYAEDINDSNQIVGLSASGLGGADEINTVRCTPPAVPGGPATFLALRNGFGGPLSINNHGDILGRDAAGTALFVEPTGILYVPRYSGYLVTPQALNDNCELVGYAYYSRALKYSLVSGFRTLSKTSLAVDINNAGDAVGYAVFKGQDRHAMWWYVENGVEYVKDLGTLGGKTSSAALINNAANPADRTNVMIVGTSSNKSGANRPFIYTKATGMVDLLSCIVGEVVIDPNTGQEVTVPADPNWGFTPMAINDKGQIGGDLCGGIPWQAARLDPVE